MSRRVAPAMLQDPVTAHLRTDFARVSVEQTVGQALAALRQNPPEGRIVYFYVVDAGGRLVGVMPSRRLLFSDPAARVSDVMVGRVVTLPARATVEDVCEFFIQHRLLALPVVDENGVMLGVVDLELYTDEVSNLSEASTRNDLFQLVGMSLAQGPPPSPIAAFRRRFPWLACNLAAGILAAFLSGVFQDELNRVVALAFFIPVVLNLAESVSSQSVSLALQVLHSGVPDWKTFFRRLRNEAATGLLLGAGSGLVIAAVALAWLRHREVALSILGGVAGGVTGAALLGLAIPIVLRRMHLEPRVASGPVSLASADIITILIYLNLARWLLH